MEPDCRGSRRERSTKVLRRAHLLQKLGGEERTERSWWLQGQGWEQAISVSVFGLEGFKQKWGQEMGQGDRGMRPQEGRGQDAE